MSGPRVLNPDGPAGSSGALPSLRDLREVQMAHDLLARVIVDKKLFERLFPTAEVREAVAAHLDSLCWVLKHEHGLMPALLLYIEFELLAKAVRGPYAY